MALVEEAAGLGQAVGRGEAEREVEPRLVAQLLLPVQVPQVKQARRVTCPYNINNHKILLTRTKQKISVPG